MSQFKRKRIAWAILWLSVLSLALVVLGGSFYRLYIEAEKAQRTAFTGNVLLAGQEVAARIGNKLYTQNISIEKQRHQSINDSTEVHTKNTFLFDEKTIALVKETITIYHGETTSINKDTTYFRNVLDSIPSDSVFYENFLTEREQIDINIKYDSLFSQISYDTLRQFVALSLAKYGIYTEVDFCIFNLSDNSYVLPPQSHHHDYDILNKGYVFNIPNDETHVHYLILYFPNERGYFLSRLSEIVTTIVLLIVLIALLVVALIFAWARQKKNEEVKNNFINNITHEFKTPLATIALACEALSDETVHQEKESRQAFIKIIQDENIRLQKMVTNILQLARLRKGQLQLQQEIMDVQTILESIAKNIALQVSARHGELVLNFEATHNEIFADKSHIENVFINLIENALKYSADKPLIKISTFDKENMIGIAISDNGIGIAKKDLRHIFDEFFRVQKGNVHDVKGYGLGLNYVKRIIQLHGGNISVKSELKRGSTFTIYLPINK